MATKGDVLEGRKPVIFFCDVCVCVCVCLCVCSVISDPMGYSLSGSSVRSRQEMKWVTICFSRGSSRLRDQTCISCVFCIGGRFFITAPLGKPHSSVRQGSNHKVKSEGQLQMSSLCVFLKLLGCSDLSLIFPLSLLQNVIFSELKTWLSCTYERIFVKVFTQLVI